MKKWFAFILISLLIISMVQTAGAEEMLRERKLIVNGVEETLSESKYVSQSGFVLWVDADHFWPMNMNGGGNDEFVDTAAALSGEEADVYVVMVGTEVPAGEGETFIQEATALYPPENVSEVEHVLLLSGLEYHVQQAVEEGTVYRFYAVKGPEYLVCVTAAFPEEKAGEYVTRVNAMVNTMEFLP